MKVFITKYALTQGVIEREVEPHPYNPQSVCSNHHIGYSVYYHRGEWHRTKELAIARANQMRDKKLDNLKKQIKTLEGMIFE